MSILSEYMYYSRMCDIAVAQQGLGGGGGGNYVGQMRSTEEIK